MSLKEKLSQVLEVLRTEESLHDDTYLAQFLDNTATVIQSRHDLELYGLDLYLHQNLKCLKEKGFQAKINIKFLFELTRTVVKSGEYNIIGETHSIN